MKQAAAAFLASLLVVAALPAQQPDQPTPISVGIVLDTSGSMREKMPLARQFLSELLRDRTQHDEIALIEGSGHPIVLAEFGSTADKLLAYISPMEAKGRSALMDGVHLGAQVTSQGRNERKILLLISDGVDSGSNQTLVEVENSIRAAGIHMLVLGVGTPILDDAETLREFAGRAALGQLAENVGGRRFELQYPLDVPRIVAELRAAMRAPEL